MAKRVKFQIGDLVSIPLENESFGSMVGRILNIDGGSVLLEVYRTHPIANASEFDYDAVKDKRPILIMWCYNKAIKNGSWVIFDRKPVESYGDIYFYSEISTDEFSLTKDNGTVVGELTGVRVSAEEAKKHYPYGISNEIALPRRLKYLLQAEGILSPDSGT
ncbi:Imm26 family immunity protein [Cohnella faecalis]|uniref:Uncharacterized protein n=1 Tax=Cohnella faecalis TaxID=2315694 RepID=A0A398CUA2_9BACL|nr:Imm26 family immunity protein [Cohnella faecalis]RIE02564.1 hypothetical protein D3H35_17915 [Cohnella faecalis]